MARCKCLVCKAELDTTTAYKVEVVVNKKNGEKELKNTYYCNEEEYIAEKTRKTKAKEDKDKVYYLISDMFGYEILNTKFFDEWRLWTKLQTNENIYKYLRDNEEYLQQICDRQFKNECNKIMYFSAILKNSLRDYKPKVEAVEKPKVVVEEQYETKYKPKTRTALLDLEEDCE